MNCTWVEKLSAMIDGELSAEETRAMERHLVACAECQQARSEFLSFRTQITTIPTLDHAASRQALARILDSAEGNRVAARPRARSLGLFGALGFKPAFAGLAILILVAIVGLALYRNITRQNQQDFVATEKRNGRATPRPVATPESSSQTPKSTDGPAAKPPSNKGAKPKSRPSLFPKLPTVPDDRISPNANQAIAENSAEGFDSGATSLTARHLEQSELLLRAFRNVRTGEEEVAEVSYEKQRAQRLVYQNIMLRREADASGDIQVSTLLETLEPILLDIANLSDKPHEKDVKAIKERLQRKNLVALLQVNSTALARAND